MRIRVFISSVQKELGDERLALQILLSTDPFLSQHCVPVLFEEEPTALRPDPQAYLELLRSCQVYVGIVWKEYGRPVDGLSATHHEYRFARELKLPALIIIKGPNDLKRSPEADVFINEIKSDGHKYERFDTIEGLQEAVRKRLVRHIKETYDIEPTSDQNTSALQTIHIASLFERQRLDVLPWDSVNKGNAFQMVANAEGVSSVTLYYDDVKHSLWQRGYLWKDDGNHYYATAAGIMLLAPDPSIYFAHARIQVAAFPGSVRTASPIDHATIRKPLSQAIDEVVAFIRRNTRHPLRVVGLQRIEVDEYPEEAVREALVNALAHRDYEDSGRRVAVEVYKDRIEIVSPGSLPGHLTLARLRSGNARSSSRNPNIAQGLVFLGRMEERGTGIARMRDAMLNHGLDAPLITIADNEVVVTLKGPGDDMDRIRIPENITGGLTPSVAARLNERQKAILAEIVQNGSVSTGWITKTLGIVKDTAARDIKELVGSGLIEPKGQGRGRHYILKT
jgi:predicted HTH transcriptional regulator